MNAEGVHMYPLVGERSCEGILEGTVRIERDLPQYNQYDLLDNGSNVGVNVSRYTNQSQLHIPVTA